MSASTPAFICVRAISTWLRMDVEISLVTPNHDHGHYRPVIPPPLSILTKHVHSFLEIVVCARCNPVSCSNCGRCADTNLVANRNRSHRLSVCRSCIAHSTVNRQVFLYETSEVGCCRRAHAFQQTRSSATYAASAWDTVPQVLTTVLQRSLLVCSVPRIGRSRGKN